MRPEDSRRVVQGQVGFCIEQFSALRGQNGRSNAEMWEEDEAVLPHDAVLSRRCCCFHFSRVRRHSCISHSEDGERRSSPPA